jgi:hypothetical protein
MIAVCVCFNSRVQLTVPSFTAWLRSRYSKASFIVLPRPAQGEDKGFCHGCHRVKKWVGRVAFCISGSLIISTLNPASWPPLPAPSCPDPFPKAPPHPRPSQALQVQQSEGPEFEFCYCLIVCVRNFISQKENGRFFSLS